MKVLGCSGKHITSPHSNTASQAENKEGALNWGGWEGGAPIGGAAITCKLAAVGRWAGGILGGGFGGAALPIALGACVQQGLIACLIN